MPLEGHWARTQTPTRSLARHERRLARVAAVLIGAAVVAMFCVIALVGSADTAARGCVDATVASTTGGARLHVCGARARGFCAAAAGSSRDGMEARAACRRAGL